MRLQHTQLTGLLGAIVLSAGLAATVASADDSSKQSKSAKDGVVEQKGNAESPDLDRSKDGMVQVRVSLPDGRTIITYERATKRSARVSPTVARYMLGQGGTASQKSSSSRSGGKQSSSASSGRSGGGSFGGGTGSSGSSGGAGSSGASGSSGSASSAGSSGGAGQASAGSGSGSGRVGQGSSPAATSSRAVHTVGGARHVPEGAVGGQRVEFNEAGMSAVVVGNTIYFTGVQLVQANQAFDALTGTRIGADSVIMQEGRLGVDNSNPLSAWSPGASPIKLDFQRNSTVELVMFSEPENASTPDRQQRTWTVRVR